MSASDDRGQARFQALFKSAQAGSQEAARELYETYVKYVIKCVRHRMWRRMRTRFDSADFVQQVWASFFTEDNLPDFQTPEELIGFLQKIAEHKVILENRRHGQQKQNLRRECPIDEQDTHVGYHPAAQDPTPSAVAVYREQYDRLIGQQAPEVREVAELRAQGNTFHEIAESLNINERTARRFMRRLKRTTPDPDQTETSN